ncbi:MAG: class I SAM-dependent methyltransferase [Cyclonatronaceae bacterium]
MWSPEELLQKPGITTCRHSGNRSLQNREGGKAVHEDRREHFVAKSMAERSNLWRLTAAVYEPLWRRYSTGILTRGAWTLSDECSIIGKMLSPQSEGVYLDAGCSTGVYARALFSEEPNCGVVLLDYSRPMLLQAARKTGKSYRAAFLQCDAADLPFADGCFDGIVMGGTLNELTEPKRVLRELLRVLKRDGRFVMMYLVRNKKKMTVVQKLAETGGVWLPDEQESEDLYRDAGFKVDLTRAAGSMRISLLRRVQ